MPFRYLSAFILVLPALAGHARASTPPTTTILTSFTGGLGGAYPAGGLVADTSGNLYGVTTQGGNCADEAVTCGILFRLTPPAAGKSAWTQTTLLDFNGTKGATPEGTLIIDNTGALYGTAWEGGKNGGGVVFKLAPPATGKTKWAETVLHSFGGSGDGASPYGGLTADADGNLYGTTNGGGSAGDGVVFKLARPATARGAWKETILHDFTGGSDGNGPFLGSLAIDAKGALYGTTLTGGTGGYGIVFKLAPGKTAKAAWTETILHAFAAGADGATPKGGVILDAAGNVYGTTYTGTIGGWGSVFELTPPASNAGAWTQTQIHVFAGGAAGGSPYAALTPVSGGGFYGTTSNCIYALAPAEGGGWDYSVVHYFTGNPDGNVAEAALIQDTNGNLYGTTYGGGLDYGTVFEVAP